MPSLFEQLRHPSKVKNAKAVFFTGLFGLIALMFVFTGLTPDRGGGQGSATAATVNNTIISTQDLQESAARYEAQAGSDKGLPAAQRQMREQRIRENALQELVTYEVVFQSAKHVGIMPTAAATRSIIVNIPAFQEDGRFQRDHYKAYLESRNMSAGEFEAKLQREVVIGQVRDIFLSAWAQPDLVGQLEGEARDTKVDIEVVKIDPKTLASSAVTAADVSQYLSKDENKQKVTQYFNSHKEEFSTPEQVRARHILLKGDTPEIQAKIASIRKEITAANFSALAKKYSQDEGSKVKGGDLNYFGRGQMVPEFEKVAFDGLKVGQISEPFKSPFGYHIMILDEKKPAMSKTLEMAQSDIARNLLAEEKREKINEEFAAALKSKGDVPALLSRYNLKWEDLGPISVTQSYIDKVESGDQVIEAAIGLKPGEVHPELIRAGQQSYVVRLKNVVGAVPKSDKTPLPSYARFGGGGEVLGQWAEELRKEARIRLNESVLK